MTSAITFVRILLQIALLCQIQADKSPLVKICHEHIQGVCIGVYIRSQWVLASSRCKQLGYKNAKVIAGNLERDCSHGETSRVLRIYDMKEHPNLLLLKVGTIFVTKGVPFVKIDEKFKTDSCGTYCLRGTDRICGRRINPTPTTIVPCKNEIDLNDKVCLKADNYTAVSNLDGSPMLCNGNIIGYASFLPSKNLLTLVNISKLYNEIDAIITIDAKMQSLYSDNRRDEIVGKRKALRRNFIMPSKINKKSTNLGREIPHGRLNLLVPKKHGKRTKYRKNGKGSESSRDRKDGRIFSNNKGSRFRGNNGNLIETMMRRIKALKRRVIKLAKIRLKDMPKIGVKQVRELVVFIGKLIKNLTIQFNNMSNNRRRRSMNVHDELRRRRRRNGRRRQARETKEAKS